MLHFLRFGEDNGEGGARGKGQGGGGGNRNDDGDDGGRRARALLVAAEEAKLRAEAEGRQISEGILREHDEAVRRAKEELLGIGGKTTVGGEVRGKNGDNYGMDWGTIAVYTCTASCSSSGAVDKVDTKDDGMGSYREEAGWRQPPLG